jgi:hypothetical protein
MIKVKEGQIGLNRIMSAKVAKMKTSKYLQLKVKPLILHNGNALSFIADNTFVISGIGYGDCDHHYMDVNDEFVYVIKDTIVVNHLITKMITEAFSTCPDLTETKHFNASKTYIMHDPSLRLFKIGKSKSPTAREGTLQGERPTIELIATLDADIELSLHDRFKSRRKRGEWFDLSWNEILDLIKEMNFKMYK